MIKLPNIVEVKLAQGNIEVSGMVTNYKGERKEVSEVLFIKGSSVSRIEKGLNAYISGLEKLIDGEITVIQDEKMKALLNKNNDRNVLRSNLENGYVVFTHNNVVVGKLAYEGFGFTKEENIERYNQYASVLQNKIALETGIKPAIKHSL